ncbi:MAG: hypothetical protein ACRC4X_02360, partial [Cetobacterium sp.]
MPENYQYDFTGKYRNMLFTQATAFWLFNGKRPFTQQHQHAGKFRDVSRNALVSLSVQFDNKVT